MDEEGGGGDAVVLGARDVEPDVEDGADVADELEDEDGDVEEGGGGAAVEEGGGAAVVAGAVVDGAAVVAGAWHAAAEVKSQ